MGDARVSQVVAELFAEPAATARVSQFVVELFLSSQPGLYPIVTVSGVDVSAYIIKETVEIEEVLFGTTASLRLKAPSGFPFASDSLQGRPITLYVPAPVGGDLRVFAGHILLANMVNQAVEVKLPLYDLRCIDFSWQLDWKAVQARKWVQVPAEQILEEMIADFCPDFTHDLLLGGIILPPDVGPTFPERLTFAASLPRVGYTWTNGQAIAEDIGGALPTGAIKINITGVQIVDGISYESDVSNDSGTDNVGARGIRASWDRPTGGDVFDHYRIYWNTTNGGPVFHPYVDDISGTPVARFLTHDNSTFDGNPLAGTRDFSIDITAAGDGTDYLDLSAESVAGLVDFESNSDEAPSAFLTRFMALIGGYWWLDYDLVIHARLLTAEPDGTQPDDLTNLTTDYRLFTHQRDVSQVRTRVRCVGGSTATSAGVSVGATSVPVRDTLLFADSGGYALAGANRITYTGRSTTSGAGNLTGVTGVAYAMSDGDSVQILAEQSDTYAAAVIAAFSGGDGIIEQSISDGDANDAQARQLAHADLLLNATPDATISFETFDPLCVPGRTVTVDITNGVGETIEDAFTIQSVRVDMCGFSPSLYPRRRVTAGRARQDLYQLLKPLATVLPQ